MKNNIFLKALRCEKTDKTPVWVMRQAGRYLPEYRALRAKAGSFLTLCKTPELACEVTLQPLRRFDLDASIIFSDILTIPDAMGLGLYFTDGEGPRFTRAITSVKEIENLTIPDPAEKLTYVTDAIRLVKAELKDTKPLIGFAGSPWTLAAYMLENGGSKNFHVIKKLMYSDPTALHLLLDKLTQSIIIYLKAQIAAGVNAVMIFDSWGGVLTPAAYQSFSLAYLQKIVTALKGQVPSILFTKAADYNQLSSLANTGCSGVGIDWTLDMAEAKKTVAGKVALQGNLDPAVLLSTPQVIRAEVKKIIQAYGDEPGHIFNLGHGITPDVPPENLAVMVDAVHEFSQK